MIICITFRCLSHERIFREIPIAIKNEKSVRTQAENLKDAGFEVQLDEVS